MKRIEFYGGSVFVTYNGIRMGCEYQVSVLGIALRFVIGFEQTRQRTGLCSTSLGGAIPVRGE